MIVGFVLARCGGLVYEYMFNCYGMYHEIKDRFFYTPILIF